MPKEDDKKRKLLFITDHFDVGGVARNYCNLANELTKQGHEVSILCLFKTGSFVHFLNPNVQIQVLSGSTLISKFIHLVRFFERDSYEFYFSSKEAVNIFTFWAHKLSSCSNKIALIINTNLSKEFMTKKFAKRLLLTVLTRFTYRFVKNSISVSEGVKGEAIRFNINSSNVIYNPVINEENKPLQREVENYFVNIGRFVPQKNQAEAIKAFSKSALIKDTKLLLIGNGPLKSSLQKLISDLNVKDKVEILENITDVTPYLRKAKGLIFTSIYEGFGNTIVEALFEGCPVIAYDCDYGPSEIITNDQYGILINNPDEEKLIEVLNNYHNHNFNEEKFREKSLKFTTKKSAQSYLNYIRKNLDTI